MSPLPYILSLITLKPRYKPEIKWSKNSWTHNIFRVYEMIFWRREGIRAEISTSVSLNKDKLIITHKAHSFEGFCALLETYIRELLKFRLHIPVKIWIPQLSSPLGLPKISPFLFAVAFDTSAKSGVNGSTTNPLTFSHTCTGSNLFLGVGLSSDNPAQGATTYNSVSLTTGTWQADSAGNSNSLFNYKFGPSTGSNTVSITTTGSNSYWGAAASYSGVSQVGLDSSNIGKTTVDATSFALSTTVVATNCWLVGISSNEVDAGMTSNGSSQTVRQSTVDVRNNGSKQFGGILMDSNATVGTGSQSLTATCNTSCHFTMFLCSIAPVASGGGTIKFLNLLGVGV